MTTLPPLRAVVELLASEPEQQLLVLGELPHDSGKMHDREHDAVSELWRKLLDFYFLKHETVEELRNRRGWPGPALADDSTFLVRLKHLATVVELVKNANRPFHRTSHGIRNSPEWAVIRHLAGECLALDPPPTAAAVDDLKESLAAYRPEPE
jgi:hypothetical protein